MSEEITIPEWIYRFLLANANSKGQKDMAPKAKAKGTEAMSKGNEAIIAIPLGEISEKAPIVRHMNFRLRMQDARTLRRVYESLHGTGAQLESGKHIDAPHNAISWMLQEIERNVGR
jgi:hypothetical protein